MSEHDATSNTNPSAGAPEISIVLPAHNEIRLLATTVTNIISGLEQRKADFEILVVENGSSDGTLRLARVLAAQLPQVRVLALSNGNYGAALRNGFEAARGTYVVNFDVDYYDLGFVDTAMKLLRKDTDLVLASKRALGARDRRSIMRRTLTAGFGMLVHHFLQLDVTDTHGMKAMRKHHLTEIVDRCTMTGSLFDVEVVLHAMHDGLNVAEVPAVVVELRPPRTSVAQRSVETLFGLIRLRLSLRRRR